MRLSPSPSQARGVGDLMRNMLGEGLERPGLKNGVRDPGPLSPTLGSPCMVSRASPMHRLGRGKLRTRLDVISRWEEDHVIARAKGHELQTPKPHDGVEAKWVKIVQHSGFPWRKRCDTQKAPTWRANCRRLDSGSRH